MKSLRYAELLDYLEQHGWKFYRRSPSGGSHFFMVKEGRHRPLSVPARREYSPGQVRYICRNAGIEPPR